MNFFKANLFIVLCHIFLLTNAQKAGNFNEVEKKKNAVNIHWEIPVQIGLQYEYTLSKRLSAYVQFGILREPNSTIILKTVNALGTDEQIVDLIENAFQSGFVFKEGINYHLKKMYLGLFLQQVVLSGDETPAEIVEILLDEDLTTFPRKRGRTGTISRTLTLNTNLLQLGLHFGKKIPLKSNFFLVTEVAMSFHISSSSSIESPQLELASINTELEDLLKDTYSSYAYIPSIKFGIGKKF